MPTIKVRDLAFVRLRSPDLDVQEQFLLAFGLKRAARTSTALYMRGTDPMSFCHITEKGDPAFLGLGWHARDAEDLRKLAGVAGASGIENLDAPGGGRRVPLQEPNGYSIDVVNGMQNAPELDVPARALNSGSQGLNRAGTLMRIPPGPSAVKRIAHGVIFTPLFSETLRWYRDTLGLISSDDMYVGHPDNVVGSFNRCDCGDDYVDHHAFFCMQNARAGLNHVSFEVHDIDDVFIGHAHLKEQAKYQPVWGIGRHLLGSQVFDYWKDPWGRVHEHWADSDRLNVHNGSNLLRIEEGLLSQWGERPPEEFVGYVSS